MLTGLPDLARAIAARRPRRRRPRARRRRLGARRAARPRRRRTSTSRCSACQRDRLLALLERSAASTPSARASRSTRSATSTSRCRAANRRPDAATRASPSRATRRCRSKRPRAGATSPINAISLGSADRRDPRSVRRPRRSRAPAACASSIRGRSATTACACCARCSSPRASSSTLDDDTRALLPGDSARRSAGRAHLGRDREAAASAPRPSIGFALALDLGVVDRLFPELQALVGCPQEPEWHPEGDVWVHTLMVIDRRAQRIDDLDRGRGSWR